MYNNLVNARGGGGALGRFLSVLELFSGTKLHKKTLALCVSTSTRTTVSRLAQAIGLGAFSLFFLVSSVSAQTHLRLQNQPQHLNFLITYHTAAPGVTDDKNDGYVVGSTWIDTVAGTVYHATSVAAGAAVWFQAQPYFITSILEDADSVNFSKSIEIGTTTNSVQFIRGPAITGTKGYTLAINCNCDVAVTTGTLPLGNFAKFNSQGTLIDGGPVTARVYNSASLSIPSGAETALTFNSERWDLNNLHSTSSFTGRITMDAAHTCMVSASVAMTAGGGTFRDLSIRVNGTTMIATQDVSAVNPYIAVSTIYQFAANDYVEATIFHDAGSPINAIADLNRSPELSVICF